MILVTGATGHMGRTVVCRLASFASLDLAFEVAPHFGVKPDRAESYRARRRRAVMRWRETALKWGCRPLKPNARLQPSSTRNPTRPFQPRHEEHCIRCH